MHRAFGRPVVEFTSHGIGIRVFSSSFFSSSKVPSIPVACQKVRANLSTTRMFFTLPEFWLRNRLGAVVLKGEAVGGRVHCCWLCHPLAGFADRTL